MRRKAWEAPEVPDNALADGQIADRAIEMLDQLTNKPFFLAVGFHKPHLPFVAPKKYWDLYDEKKLKLASNPFRPKDAPGYAFTEWGELRALTSRSLRCFRGDMRKTITAWLHG